MVLVNLSILNIVLCDVLMAVFTTPFLFPE